MWGVVKLNAHRVAILQLGKSAISGSRAKDVERSTTAEGISFASYHLGKQ